MALPRWLRVAFPLSLFLSLALGILSVVFAAPFWSMAFHLSGVPVTILVVYTVKLRAFSPAPKAVHPEQGAHAGDQGDDP
jgi:heme A synthase